MKFEDFLMQPRDEKQKRHKEKVLKLQTGGEEHQNLKRVSRCTRQESALCRHCLPSLVPLQVQALLKELVAVEEEINWLERMIEKLKHHVQIEEKGNKQRQARQQHKNYTLHKQREVDLKSVEPNSAIRYEETFRRTSLLWSCAKEDAAEESRCSGKSQSQRHITKGSSLQTPNDLSEELIISLISIFLRLNRSAPENEASTNIPKIALSCMNSKGFMPKTSFNSKAPTFFSSNNAPNPDPYGLFSDFDSAARDFGPYKNFIQITRSSLDKSLISDCYPEIEQIRVLLLELCTVDLTSLTYKQKLAFWINIYNACVMHAFLQHGLPSTQEKLLNLMNKAVLNVGGVILNALAIEHFILRHPCDSNPGTTDAKEMLLRHTYGLGYPEPNVTFALCRGSWSSPALRVYTSDVINQLERAKAEYLEASVGVTIKKKIILPKLLHWHMKDFADEMESLLEWIYSQLPHSGSLKRFMIECLNGRTKCSAAKMVEIQPYVSEFRYLMPL